MQTLTKILLEQGMGNHLLNDTQLARIIEGSDQRRYNLVNRAIKAGELYRLRRGVYLLSQAYRDHEFHPFAIAQQIVPGSYISLETALSYHGWIPEAVYTTVSIVPGRKSIEFTDPLIGRFSYHPLPLNHGHFLELVLRETIDRQGVLIARPLRALMDLVCFRKMVWQGLAWFEESMRIDAEVFGAVGGAQLRTLKLVYKHKRMQHFLVELENALGLELRHEA